SGALINTPPIIELDAHIPVHREVLTIADEALRDGMLTIRKEMRKLKKMAGDEKPLPPKEGKMLVLMTEALSKFKRTEIAARNSEKDAADGLAPQEVLRWVIEKAAQLGVAPEQLPSGPLPADKRFVEIADVSQQLEEIDDVP